jgi:hypothetical protein
MQESEQVKEDWPWINQYDVGCVKMGSLMPDARQTG